MPISEPITPPSSPKPRELRITPMTAVGVTRSPFTGKSHAYAYQAQQWMLSASWDALTRAQSALLEAFVLKCNGPQYRFLWGFIEQTAPQGTWAGTPLVNGANQTGVDLNIDGLTPSVTGIIKANDVFQLGTGLTSRLYRVTDDVNSNGSGQATLPIWPAITADNKPADNAAIVTASPRGIFRLTGMPTWNIERVARTGFSITAISEP